MTEKKNRHILRKLLVGILGLLVAVYVLFSLHVFYNFMKIMLTDKEAAKGNAVVEQVEDGADTEN